MQLPGLIRKNLKASHVHSFDCELHVAGVLAVASTAGSKAARVVLGASRWEAGSQQLSLLGVRNAGAAVGLGSTQQR